MRVLGREPCLLQRLRDRVQIPVQLIMLRLKRRVLTGGEALRLGHGICEFRQPPLEFRLCGFGGMPLFLEHAIRLQQAHLQLLAHLAKLGALLTRFADGLRTRGLHLGQLPREIVPHLRELKILLIRRALALLQRGERRRKTAVDFIPL